MEDIKPRKVADFKTDEEKEAEENYQFFMHFKSKGKLNEQAEFNFEKFDISDQTKQSIKQKIDRRFSKYEDMNEIKYEHQEDTKAAAEHIIENRLDPMLEEGKISQKDVKQESSDIMRKVKTDIVNGKYKELLEKYNNAHKIDITTKITSIYRNRYKRKEIQEYVI